MNYIHGPIISSSDLDFHVRMFEQVFDMQTSSNEKLSLEQVLQTWGLGGHTARTAVVETAGSDYGVRIVEFTPSSSETIRHRSKGMIPGAAKVIDFFVDGMEEALERARKFGLLVNDDIAEYDAPEGRVREAHTWVLDEIVCALIESPREMVDKFTAGMNRRISEPQSISGPTMLLTDSVDFFEKVLGFATIYEYEVNDSNFGDMIGSDAPVHIKAKNIGSDLRQPYIGLIDYGRNSSNDEPIATARPPIRGLLGVTIVSREIDSIAERAVAWSGIEYSVSKGVSIAPWGECSSLLLDAPNGMLLHVIEPSRTST